MTTLALECTLDQQPVSIDSGLKTWGDLLVTVDRDLAVAARAVTAVRFDGVDQPSFRDPGMAGRPLATLGQIEADSLDTHTLLQHTLAVAIEGLAVLAGGSRRVATAFRGADVSGANAELANLLEAVQSLVTLTAAIGDTACLDLTALQCGQTTGDRTIARVADALGSLVAWQQARDWVAVADGLEYELAPALAGWRDLLNAMELGDCA